MRTPTLPTAAASLLVALTSASPAQVLREYWTGITGTSVANLTSSAAYAADQPTGRDFLARLQATGWTTATASATNNLGNYYGQRLRGYVIPPASGAYRFWITSDDSSQLFLSTDDRPANKALIASISGYVASLVWNGKPSQMSPSITLQAGQRYYFEVLHKDGSGNDHLAVGWAKPGQPTTTPSEIIPGAVLEPYLAPALDPDQVAARFLQQATFGATPASIADVRNRGIDGWITAQFQKPVGDVTSVLNRHYQANPTATWLQHFGHALCERMITSDDQLRQRVAFALSQIFVVSQRNNTIQINPRGTASYYDMLLRNSFGNFRTLLHDVAMHPIMGVYLSHRGNRKANTAVGRYPDENFAREIMQLFSIGLYELTPDGRDKLDLNGEPIPTYTNVHITNFARVFTGLGLANGSDVLGGTDYINPMKMFESEHDTGAKTLLAYSGSTTTNLPAGQAGLQDVNAAIDNLANHPNTAPFISRLLIQHLVTSNPSHAYIGRVADAFRTSNGDMKTIIRAILTDAEARDVTMFADAQHGRKRDPWTQLTAMARAFNATPYNTFLLPWDLYDLDGFLGMYPMRSPSVFNFYLPNYQPPGPVLEAGLVGPEFQIQTAFFGIKVPNYFKRSLEKGLANYNPSRVRLDLTREIQLAADPAALVDHVDLLMSAGALSGRTRDRIVQLVGQVPASDPTNRARLAIYLVMFSPEFNVLK